MPQLFEHIYTSPIGRIKIVADVDCIHAITFLEDASMTSNPENLDSPAVIHQCIDELIEYFNGSRTQFTVPIHQEGTDFQQKVWKELYEVPFAKTMSYAELAKKLGDPKVIRAAASANGKNKIAIIVPCHRIIGSDRNLTGYAWGLPRKKWLLQHEFRMGLGVQTLFT
ncbi:MAG: methylated-DNA--[protein]-cysteine S-methyltransferase [Sediminibacterium sp.]